MDLDPISFFTPVKCSGPNCSLPQKIVADVDAYFHLGGPVAVWLPGLPSKVSQAVKLQEAPTGWEVYLKVASYSAVLFSGLAVSLFPVITHDPRVIVALVIVSCFPLFMLVAKLVLRTVFQFHLYREKVEKPIVTQIQEEKKVIAESQFKQGMDCMAADPVKAAACFQKAAEFLHPHAQHMLGICYSIGI
ncbi:MAG TPA: hypothetical protein VIJ14_03135, partial [Rhabdochlamydiaceae bacterium]